jgi:hypothetical protein
MENHYLVIAYGYGENHGKHVPGHPVWTKKETVTVEKCKSIITNLGESGHSIRKLEIHMDGTKKAIYNADKNRLLIWEDGLPIYENNNGVICRDAAALADSLI